MEKQQERTLIYFNGTKWVFSKAKIKEIGNKAYLTIN